MPNALTSGKPIPVWYYGIGAGVLFIGYYFYSSSKKQKAAAALPPMATATTASQTPVVPAGSYGTGVDAGSLNNIETQLQNLNAAQATTQGSASTSGVTASQWGNLQGSGYNGGGSQYKNITTQDQIQAIIANNLDRYYEPVPGLFQKVTGKEAIGTPQFVKVS